MEQIKTTIKIAVIIMMGMSLGIHAQKVISLEGENDTNFVNKEGNIGIGTNNPNATLTIKGASESYPKNKTLYIEANGDSKTFRDQIMIYSDLDTGYGIAFAGKSHHRGGIYAENTSTKDGNITIWARDNGKISAYCLIGVNFRQKDSF